MKDSPITLADVLTIVAIASAAFGVISQLAKAGMSYLTAKFSKGATAAKQSSQCNFDHKEIHSLVLAQNANITKMLEQNGEEIKALTDLNHNAQLRHQIVLAKLERIEDHVRIPANT